MGGKIRYELVVDTGAVDNILGKGWLDSFRESILAKAGLDKNARSKRRGPKTPGITPLEMGEQMRPDGNVRIVLVFWEHIHNLIKLECEVGPAPLLSRIWRSSSSAARSACKSAGGLRRPPTRGSIVGGLVVRDAPADAPSRRGASTPGSIAPGFSKPWFPFEASEREKGAAAIAYMHECLQFAHNDGLPPLRHGDRRAPHLALRTQSP